MHKEEPKRVKKLPNKVQRLLAKICSFQLNNVCIVFVVDKKASLGGRTRVTFTSVTVSRLNVNSLKLALTVWFGVSASGAL